MAMDENMLLSDMATETRRTQRAMQQRARDTKRSAAAKGAGKSIDLEDEMTRREKMQSIGKEAASGIKRNARPLTKSEPTPVKTMQNMTTGSRSDIAAKGRAAAIKSGALKPNASMAAKSAGTIAAIEAAGPVMAAVSALAEADKATGYKRTQYSGNFGGPSFSTNPYASSSKPAYSGQSTMSKLMGVGKKGK